MSITSTALLLQLYVDAEANILAGQSVRFGERQLTLPDLVEVRKERIRLQALLDSELAGGRSRFSQADFTGGHGGYEGAEWNRY